MKLLLLILILIVFLIFNKKQNKMIYLKSNIDKQEYLVRDLPDAQKAANMLEKIKQNTMKLVEYLNKNDNKNDKDDDKNEFSKHIDQLTTRIKTTIFSENSGDNDYTSYSVSKGEELVFCLRSKHKDKMHELNLLMYVVLHEISHIACPVYGHGPLFKKIFAYFTRKAIEIDIYTQIPFESEPKEYCGIMITDSII